MHISETSKALTDFIYDRDPSNYLVGGVYHSDDPDKVPSESPSCTFAFLPAPYNKVLDSYYVDLTFWYSSPDFSKISQILKSIEEWAESWFDISDGQVIGKGQFVIRKSPLTGGKLNLSFITVFGLLRATYFEDACR